MNMARTPIASATGFFLPFCALLLSASPTPVSAAGGNPFICRDLAAERQMLAREATTRDLNFMLFEAVKSGCTDLIEKLLAAGAAVEARDRFANTPLVLAAAAGQDEAIELLLDAGAKIDHRNLAGSAPLLRAAMDNRRRTAVLLLERGADPNLANGKKLTPLHAAAYNGNGRLVQALLAHGAEADATDTTGKSPAIYAAARGFEDIVGQLIAAGVDPTRRYGNDLTLLMWAAGHSNDTPRQDGVRTVARILEAGAEIDAVDNRGWSALMIAAQRGHRAVAELLLERGADPAIADGQGRRAADLASDEALQARLLAAAR
jgi:ankyrin repeat protein